MGFEVSDKVQEINKRLEEFMIEHIYPHENEYDEFTNNQDNKWQYPDWYEDLKREQKNRNYGTYFYQKNMHLGVPAFRI